MTFLVIVTENAPPRLRGRLSLLLLEVRAGVYIGAANNRVRNQLWAMVEQYIEDGSAVLGWPDPDNPSGAIFKTIGANRRMPCQIDGVTLVQLERSNEAVFESNESLNLPVDFLRAKKSLLNN